MERKFLPSQAEPNALHDPFNAMGKQTHSLLGSATLDTDIPVGEELSEHEILEISLHLTRARSAG